MSSSSSSSSGEDETMRHRDRDVWLAQRIKCTCNRCQGCIVRARRITLNHISMYGEWIQTGLEVSRWQLMEHVVNHGVQINGARCNTYAVIEAGCSTTP